MPERKKGDESGSSGYWICTECDSWYKNGRLELWEVLEMFSEHNNKHNGRGHVLRSEIPPINPPGSKPK